MYLESASGLLLFTSPLTLALRVSDSDSFVNNPCCNINSHPLTYSDTWKGIDKDGCCGTILGASGVIPAPGEKELGPLMLLSG